MSHPQVAVLPDITVFMVRYMCLTSVALGCRILNGPDDKAVGVGLCWFGGWALLLTKAILEGTTSGPVARLILEWHVLCVAVLSFRVLTHPQGAYILERPSSPLGTLGSTYFVDVEAVRLRGRAAQFCHWFTVRNLIVAQCALITTTATFFPKVFFEALFFQYGEPSVPARFFSQGLALNSLLFGAMTRFGTNKQAAKNAVFFSSGLVTLSILTCGNLVSPIWSPLQLLIAVYAVRAHLVSKH